MPDPDALRDRLDALAALYERPAFVDDDPVSLPHAFDAPADQETIGLSRGPPRVGPAVPSSSPSSRS